MTYDSTNRKHLRLARRAAEAALAAEARVVSSLMSGAEGRAWIHDFLVRTHIFSSSFNGSALGTAFAEGERNIGLQLLSAVTRCAPDQYIFMMREAQDRNLANDRYHDSNDRRGNGNNPRRDGDDSGAAGRVDSDYDPGLDDADDTAGADAELAQSER